MKFYSEMSEKEKTLAGVYRKSLKDKMVCDNSNSSKDEENKICQDREEIAVDTVKSSSSPHQIYNSWKIKKGE